MDIRETVDAALSADPFTEDALALRFSERHADDLRYIATKGQWLKWDGDRWLPEATLLAFDLARQRLRADAQQYGNGKPPIGTSSAKTVAAVERLAKADRRQAATLEQWDADDWATNAGGATSGSGFVQWIGGPRPPFPSDGGQWCKMTSLPWTGLYYPVDASSDTGNGTAASPDNQTPG